MSAVLKMRPMRADDEPFLRLLREQVDSERLGLQHLAPEDEEFARKIVDLQYRGHAAHYKQVKSKWDTQDCIIEIDGQPAGRFILTQDSKVVMLADLVVDRAYRGKGVGQAVIEGIKAECVQSKRLLRLHVDINNSAVYFYLQLGFVVVEQKPVQFLMEWSPPSMPARPSVFSPRS